jgi:hypothetical protein
MISDSLVVSIKAFMDATSLVQKPEYTWLQRNLILRILYGIRGIDINSCVKNLEDSGLFIGLYNVIGTENHLLYKLHAMDLSDWIRLVTSINTKCIDTIFTELRMFYGHDLETSPLWNMKKTFEESQIEYVDDPNLLLHVFLVVNNREIAKDEALFRLLSKKYTNVMDKVLRILGHTNSNTFQRHTEADLCIILKYIDFTLVDFLNEKITVTTHVSKKIDSFIGIPSTHRCSLLSLQQEINSSELQKTNISDNYSIFYPADMNVSLDVWNLLSCAQRQFLLLVACIKPDTSVEKHKIASVISNINIGPGFDTYVFKKHRIDNVFRSISPIFQRLGDYVDITQTELLSVISAFTEFAYNGIFGLTQQKVMTVSFSLQMYILAYLEHDIQLPLYKLIVDTFNKRVRQFNPELVIVEYIPPSLLICFNKWSSMNMFSRVVVDFAIMPLLA